MPLRQQAVFMSLALVLLLVIVELVRRRRLRVEYSWLWLASGASIIGLILDYRVLIRLTDLLGAAVPTSTLFFLCILYLALLSLNYSVRLSTLNRQVKDLALELALLKAERDEAGDGRHRPGPLE
jgi:hypothetical protein